MDNQNYSDNNIDKHHNDDILYNGEMDTAKNDKSNIYSNMTNDIYNDETANAKNNRKTYENVYDDLYDDEEDDKVYEIGLDKIELSDLEDEKPGNPIEIMTFIRTYGVTIVLLIANIFVYFFMSVGSSDLFKTAGLNYEYIHDNKEYIRILTYMFIHANIGHFFNNMVALVVFGSQVEKRVGQLKMTLMYFTAGIIGGIISVLASHIVAPDEIRYAAGASAAIFGVMCAAIYLIISDNRNSTMRRSSIVFSIVIVVIYAVLSNTADTDIWGHIGGGIAGGIIAFAIKDREWGHYKLYDSRRYIGIVAAIIICVIAIANISTITEATAQAVDDRVNIVRNQRIYSDDNNITFGSTFDDLTNADWIVFTSTDEQVIVQYTGETYYDGYIASITMQFMYYDEYSRWVVSYFGINGEAQDSDSFYNVVSYLNQAYFNQLYQGN